MLAYLININCSNKCEECITNDILLSIIQMFLFVKFIYVMLCSKGKKRKKLMQNEVSNIQPHTS